MLLELDMWSTAREIAEGDVVIVWLVSINVPSLFYRSLCCRPVKLSNRSPLHQGKNLMVASGATSILT